MFTSIMFDLYFVKGNSECNFCIPILVKTNRHIIQNNRDII